MTRSLAVADDQCDMAYHMKIFKVNTIRHMIMAAYEIVMMIKSQQLVMVVVG